MTSVVRSPLAQPFLEQLILKPNESFELPDENLEIFQRLKRAVQYDSEKDFISCLAEVDSTVDLVMQAYYPPRPE